MKMKTLLFLSAFLLGVGATSAQNLPRKVENVKILDLQGKPAQLPYFGEKNLMIFYVDPDHANQNTEFIDHLEKNHILSDNIHSFGIVNLKDAPMLPNSIVRAMVRKKINQTGADIYTDPDHLLRDGWNLGDVNNQFTLIFVTKDLEIKFLSKGELTQEQIKEFYRVIDEYK